MTVKVTTGGELDLTAIDPGLRKVRIGLGWDVPDEKGGEEFDLDASAFLLGLDNKVRRDTDFVFYNNLETEGGAVTHHGDNPTGQGEGDDEVISVNLDIVPFDVEKVVFAATIHNADERAQHFGHVSNAYIRILNEETGVELARFDLTEDAAHTTAITFGEIIRDGIMWKFRAIGLGNVGGLYRLATDYGVNVTPL